MKRTDRGTLSATLTEGRKVGATEFFIGGGINIELRLGNAAEDLHNGVVRDVWAREQWRRRGRHHSREENYGGCNC